MNSLNPAPLFKSCFIIFITSLLFFYEFSLGNIYNSFGPYLAPEFNLSPTKLGFVSSLYFYTSLLFLIPAGLLVDRFSPRKVICIVLIISAGGVVWTSATHSLTMLIILRLLMGLGSGFCLVSCIRIAVNWFNPRYLARVSGFIIMMGMLGGLLVQTPLTILITHIGWRLSMLTIGLVGLSCMILIFIFVRDVPKEHEEASLALRTRHSELGTYSCLKLALLKKQNWFCGLYTGLMNLPIYMLGALWGIPYLIKVHHLSLNSAATVSGMLYLGSMIGSPLLGFCSDILQRRRLPMQISAVIAIFLMLILTQINLPSMTSLIAIFLALGIITSSQIISYPTVIESNSKMISSSATCVISMMCMGGGALIQPLFGYILSYHAGTTTTNLLEYPATSYQLAIYALPLAFLIALILTFFIRETHCHNISEEK